MTGDRISRFKLSSKSPFSGCLMTLSRDSREERLDLLVDFLDDFFDDLSFFSLLLFRDGEVSGKALVSLDELALRLEDFLLDSPCFEECFLDDFFSDFSVFLELLCFFSLEECRDD